MEDSIVLRRVRCIHSAIYLAGQMTLAQPSSEAYVEWKSGCKLLWVIVSRKEFNNGNV